MCIRLSPVADSLKKPSSSSLSGLSLTIMNSKSVYVCCNIEPTASRSHSKGSPYTLISTDTAGVFEKDIVIICVF